MSSDIEMDAEKPKVRAPIKTSKKQTPSRKRQQKKRHEGFRDMKNRDFTARQDALIKSKMQPLFDLEHLEALGTTTVEVRTVPLPVSTRGLGFGLFQCVRGAIMTSATIQVTRPSMLAMYRHCQLKLAAHWMKDVHAIIDRQQFTTPFITEAVRHILEKDTWIPRLVAGFMEGIGTVTMQSGASYAPVLPLNPDVNGVVWPRPDNVTILNLRQTVVALANPQTPEVVRAAFIQHNPIPGANFVNNLLMNPDEIIPDGYGPQQMLVDVGMAHQVYADIQKKAPKYISTIPKDSKGSLSILTSYELNEPSGIPSCPDLLVNGIPQNIGEWIINNPLPIVAGSCYYSDQLAIPEVVNGAINMYGEWLPPPYLRTGLNEYRNPGRCPFQSHVSRSEALTVLFGTII